MALGSAILYALASVLQQRSAAATAPHARRGGLIMALARRPLWLLGIVADVVAYSLQFMSLEKGSLVVVQPILISGLLFALPIGAAFGSGRVKALQWASAVAVVVGLSVFLLAAQPAVGYPDPSHFAWMIIVSATSLPAALLVLWARRLPPWPKAAALAAATGLLFGLVAALTKESAHLLSHSFMTLATSWEPYALIAVGAAALSAGQNAFAAGPLTASLPMLTVVDPLASVAIGAGGFGEGLSMASTALITEAFGVMLLVLGVIGCSRAPRIDRDSSVA